MKKKIMKSFRLSHHAITILELLSKELKLPQSSIIEKALEQYLDHVTKHEILKFAGILTPQEGEDMLESIHSSRQNKKIISWDD